ncbi:adenylate/guanylate cyclase domain-containing protein [Pigmentibacter sp. JX0631]|uniref:adenylate/guanylate cyclase domain-containing protein n=1 Tax=Pigmentibacter sp. JX0631 TaxID=2976982 RepID=UPI0024684D73|nr:adenylate/guanylate cyclase domain-containing protein [Pigmentibacter sp. JX0631]WGL60811.1 adenylate/guanylate cyclase domain-containing protein [Pigmentibacter sp. JX0631]
MSTKQSTSEHSQKKSKLFHFLLKPSSFKVGIILTALSLFFLVRHYTLPKNSIDIVGQLERELYDIRFKLRGQREFTGIVGTLSADDKSLEKFGRWPFPRGVYAQAFENLKNAGVKWIGFDVFFSEQSHRLLKESVPELKEIIKNNSYSSEKYDKLFLDLEEFSPGDVSLGKSIESFGKIAQGFFYVEHANQIKDSSYDWYTSFLRLKNSAIDFLDFPTGYKLANYRDILSPGVVTNTAVIAGKAKYMGFANNQSDSDGMIRKSTLIRGIEPINKFGEKLAPPILVPSLALSLAANYLESAIIVHFDSAGVDSIELYPSDNKKKQIKIPVYFDGLGKLLINHYAEFSKIPQISLVDAYDNKLPKNIPKILVYGGTATGTNDKRPSPFDENFDGVGHHVAIIENILTQNFMQRPLSAPVIEVSLLLISGIIFSYALKYLNALKSSIFIISVLLSFFYIDEHYLFGKGNWYYAGMFYVQSISIYFGITVFKYFTEEKEKKKVRGAFQHYLNPAVINQLLEHPERLKLGGDKKFMTVFFSDVRGFTTISESLTPEKLTSVLNEYFTPMTKIILDSNGLLDKYIGDAIMAVWGAPIPIEDHADRALISSLKMLDELEKLQKKWAAEGLPFLDIGIGLNTGDMVVGNMGSDQRFDYTVLGDSVNLGARLEGINKNYGTRIICSEFTVKSLKNPQKFLLRELDNIQVKGKNEPVRIFEVMRFIESDRQKVIELVKLFEEGLAFYRQQEWDLAIQKFNSAIQLNNGSDPPSKEFIERCNYLKQKGLEKDWNGVWVFKTK